jgi:integrase
VHVGVINDKTTLAHLFELWIVTKAAEDGLSPQTVDQYRQVWRKHGADRLGALRIPEVDTYLVHQHLQGMGMTVQGKRLRMILLGMFSMAVRFGAVAANPVTEARPAKTVRKEPRAISADQLVRIREAVLVYADRKGPAPRPGRLLPAFVDVLVATGARPNEVLATRWCDVALDADPPTLTITGTLVDHGRVEGRPLHRQEKRKGGAPEHTVFVAEVRVDRLRSMARLGCPPMGRFSPIGMVAG